MKVAVSSSGKDLESQIDPRFGRCQYFLIVETNDMSFEAFENQSAALGGGAGIQSAQFVASKGAQAVITGNCGPNAIKTLTAGGLTVFLGVTGTTVNEAVAKFKLGDLTPASQANVPDHSGLSAKGAAASGQQPISVGEAGRRRGRGQGRGMQTGGRGGMGSGRGLGRGRNRV